MQHLVSLFNKVIDKCAPLRDLSTLSLRLLIAYGFYGPAIFKWKDINATAEWFASMHYPLPLLNAYAAATTEMAGVVLLTLGLATRLISVPLMITMIVAITTVHWSKGFSVDDGGFQIPLTYLLILFSFFLNGPGRISLDHFIAKKFTKAE